MRIRPWCVIPVAAVVHLAGAPRGSPATVWNEVGDAGDLPATAQVPFGSGTLTAIAGSLLPGGDADLYLIQIDDAAAFGATTCGGGVDTQLWLFARDGTGITFDDDDPNCGVSSAITGVHVPAAGAYVLAVSAYDWDALEAEGREIWLDEPYELERRPDGPGAPGPVAAWGDVGYEEGSYEITLAGVSWSPVGINDLPVPIPAGCRLYPNVPNPFNLCTTIRFEPGTVAPVRLCIYGATGRLVRVLAAEFAPGPADHRVIWDGRDESGRPVASGTYFYRLDAGVSSESRSMLLLR